MTPEQRQAARERHSRLQSRADNYISWAKAGGPNECGHGYAAGIPCFECDETHARTDLPAALDALDEADRIIAGLSEEVKTEIRNAVWEAETGGAAKEEVAALRSRIAELEADNGTLRELLWMRHGCNSAALYGDDGRMDCNACVIDFKSQPAREIQHMWIVRGWLDDAALKPEGR